MITEEKFIEDLKDLLEIEIDITLETDLLDIDEWDSFSAKLFLVMCKEQYGVDVEPVELAEVIFVGDLYNVVCK